MSAMEPEIVEKGLLPPGECLFTGGFENLIDTKRDLNIPTRPRGYISAAYVEELARDNLGMVPEKDVEALREAVQHFADENEELKAELAAYKRVRKELSRVG